MRTRVTEMLGIKHSVLQGSMVWVAFPELVSAVSEAGGLGILTGSIHAGEDLVTQIRAVKEKTRQPFAVNFTPSALNVEELLAVCI